MHWILRFFLYSICTWMYETRQSWRPNVVIIIWVCKRDSCVFTFFSAFQNILTMLLSSLTLYYKCHVAISLSLFFPKVNLYNISSFFLWSKASQFLLPFLNVCWYDCLWWSLSIMVFMKIPSMNICNCFVILLIYFLQSRGLITLLWSNLNYYDHQRVSRYLFKIWWTKCNQMKYPLVSRMSCCSQFKNMCDISLSDS